VCIASNGFCAGSGGISKAGWLNYSDQVILANNATNLSVGNSGGNPNLFVDNTNNFVGIGTTTPTDTLTVAGSIHAANFGNIYLDGGSSLTSGNSGIQLGEGPPYIKFFTIPNVPSVIITDSGNVGINTSNPTQTLDVNGSINVSGSAPCLAFGSDWRICLNGTTLEFYNSTGALRGGMNSTCSFLRGSSGSVMAAC
jgi:hypothetical protein